MMHKNRRESNYEQALPKGNLHRVWCLKASCGACRHRFSGSRTWTGWWLLANLWRNISNFATRDLAGHGHCLRASNRRICSGLEALVKGCLWG